MDRGLDLRLNILDLQSYYIRKNVRQRPGPV